VLFLWLDNCELNFVNSLIIKTKLHVKVTLLEIGKTDVDYLKKGIDIYLKRISHYILFRELTIPALKNTGNLSEELQKQKEGIQIIEQLQPGDELILLDEKGETYSSVAFAKFIEKKMVAGNRNLVFVIGGPYGFSDEVYGRANTKLSLSTMTFSHQMIRLIFTEQFYRAMTILKGEPYHHQ
jgi:23S rRNA (pseudouridine1915-N3)-methyltransferase